MDRGTVLGWAGWARFSPFSPLPWFTPVSLRRSPAGHAGLRQRAGGAAQCTACYPLPTGNPRSRRRAIRPARKVVCPPRRCIPARRRTVGAVIYLDKHMLCGVYQESGIRIRSHCGAEPPRDIKPPGLVATVGGRDRASASYAADGRVQAPASAARGRFRGIHGGRAAPPLPAEAGTPTGGGCLAGSVPPVLVGSRRCSGTPPRRHGSIHTTEKEGKEKKMTDGE